MPNRLYSRSVICLDDGDSAVALKTKEEAEALKRRQRLTAVDFNKRRALYKRQVSALRREYAQEISRQRAADKAEQEALKRELTRRRLERQYLKNMRTAQNMLRQRELQQQRAKEFKEHLAAMQVKREAKNERFAKARQLVVDELEEEAPLWLTSPEEVEAAFSPEAEQLLWARPGGILGAPNPSLDSHFWSQETHPWRMDRTYKSQRQVLLDELEEIAYEEANVDSSFWTPEKVQITEELENKARLRAMVRSVGRISLLRKQKQMMEDQYATAEGDVPTAMPAPSFQMLQQDNELEKEGAKLLMNDPTKFFVFEKSEQVTDQQGISDDASAYVGPTLGSPVALRDPLRENSHQNGVFPHIIGKLPKPDNRTEREKKLQEREERLWAAAQAEKMGNMDIELAAQQQTADDLEPDINYDDFEFNFGEDDDWTKGLDPVVDDQVINTPLERRYKEEDIEWVVDRLSAQVKHLEQQFIQDLSSMKQVFETEIRQVSGQEDSLLSADSLESALLNLSDKDLVLLSDLDDRCNGTISEEDLSDVCKQIPGLSRDQLFKLLTRGELQN